MSTGEKSKSDFPHEFEFHPLSTDPASMRMGESTAEDSLLEPTHPLTLPEPWKMEHPPRTAIPNTSGKSGWQQCYQRVKEYDDDMCKVWKDEIDKLLIFAGLFSAAVTAFVVESYQWLDTTGDPTSQLLAQFISIQLNTTLPALAPVTVSPSAVRINICWFLSLILSLSAVLVGVLCLQWLREYERPVATSFEDKLRYRQVRYNGLIAWKVPRIITFLPVLLQIALILFFAGVVDLLWVRNHAVAIAVLVPIACVIFFLLATSLFPVFQVLGIRQNITRVSKMTQCPYKSPLSWLIYRLVDPLLNITWSGENATWKKARNSPFRALWPRFDHLWVTSTDSRVHVLSQAVQWMKSEFKHDSTTITPVYECLKSMDGDVVRMLEEPLLQELGKICDGGFPCPTWSSDSKRIREVACILQLRGSLEDIHQVVLMEHLVRAIGQDLDFLPFVPINWASSVRSLPREQCDAFIEQILTCTLSATENSKLRLSHFSRLAAILRDVGYLVFDLPPHAGSAISYLLEMNLFKWKRWIEYGPAQSHSELPYHAPDRHKRARVVVEEFLDYFLPELFPTEVQPYLADLAWTAMKAGPTGSASVFSDWSSDAWLAFFRLNSWDSAYSQDIYRWWLNRDATLPSPVGSGVQRASAHRPSKKGSIDKSTPIFVSPGSALHHPKLVPSPDRVERKQSPWSRVQNKLGLRAEVQMREVMNRPRLSPIASSSALPRDSHMPPTLARSSSPESDPEPGRTFELPQPAVSTPNITRPELQVSIPVVGNTEVNDLEGA